MNTLIKKRILAALIDNIVILTYACLLALITFFLLNIRKSDPLTNPYILQLIGFTTLTLPVLLYSWIAEKNSWKGTLGKKILNLKVEPILLSKNANIFFRNVLKFLPWEIAHTGVHHAYHHDPTETGTPIWIWSLLILPQVVVIFYIITIFMSRGSQSIYDKFANTKICLHIN